LTSSIDYFDVFVRCGASAIKRVELGIVLPAGYSAASFGPGCTPTNCTGASELGAMVDPSASFALGPGLNDVGVRSDAVYFSIKGQLAPDSRLCSPGIEVRVATLQMSSGAPPPLPSLSTQGVTSVCPSGPSSCLQPLLDSNDQIVPPANYALVADPGEPTAQLALVPAVGDTTGKKWEVQLFSESELHRVAFGLVAPQGTDINEIRMLGCNTTPIPPARRNCTASPLLGPYVDPALSFTVGPDPDAHSSGRRTDTMYVSITGSRPAGFGLSNALNVANQLVTLGVIEMDTAPGQPPAPTFDGVAGQTIFGEPPIMTTDDLPVLLSEVELVGAFSPGADYDADGRMDETDNCPYAANSDQLNSGGLLTTVADLAPYGDRCECGEGDGTGTIFASDATALRQVLAGITVDAEATGRCSVAGGAECDVRDVVVLRRALAGEGPGLAAVCARAVRDAPPPASP
jgi:hypothetical protein